MGQSIVDLFKAETEIEIKASELFALMREATKAEMMMNAVKCEVPYRYIREMITGDSERQQSQEEKDLRERIDQMKEERKQA